MPLPAKFAVIVPCFNEARFIGSLVKELRAIIPTVVVVDDHSSDNTAEIAREAGATVLTNEHQLGKGGSLLRGLEYAAKNSFTWALLVDGDGQHAAADIPQFLSANDQAALVIGNRMHACEDMPWLRRTINRVMSKLISNLIGINQPDTQCGFRRLNLAVWQNLDLKSQKFEIESEMVVAFAKAGHPAIFVPIQVLYRDETSKIRPWADTVRWLQWYFRTRRALHSSNFPSATPALSGKSTP